MDGYIKSLRDNVGNIPLILNFSAACILDKQGRLLLQKRGDTSCFNEWGLPGGAWEFGESAEEALRREVREETGLEIKVNRLIGVYSKYFSEYDNGDKSQTSVILFECNPMSENLIIDGKETLELKYFEPNKLPKIFNSQHLEMIQDWINQCSVIYK